MTHYQITAKREVWYDIPVEANSKEEAIQKMRNIDDTQDIEEYAYDWSAFDITVEEQ
jgi:hypothetical protein